MLWIISGPTSVGKSTFISSPRVAEITGISSESSLIWPATQDRLEEEGTSDLLYHYNILRPLQLRHIRESRGRSDERLLAASASEFDRDRQWRSLTGLETEKKAVVLVCGRQTLLERMEQRRGEIETSELAESKHAEYPTQLWHELVEQVDLVSVYRAWCRELKSHGIPYILVDSGGDEYPVIEDEEHLPNIVNEVGSGYTKERIEEILHERKFAYHKVELPFGLHTKGDDRSETRDLILPESMAGKSVLDVGSALGYFCFEAEAKGAVRVVGVELKDDRFQDAEMLKDIKGSRVEFLRRDIVLDPLDETFDYVLLLNVIHHLKEPFRAIRQLASITRERLVIEFPTFENRKFRGVADIEFPSFYNDLPLIGVSSMPKADQTFVYTPEAIKRILLDHERLFDRVEIIQSSMPGRAIAVCHKSEGLSEEKRSEDLGRREVSVMPSEREPKAVPEGSKPTPRLIAFYLPQYHPIPENDVWWGKGSTEWTNVARAKPLFPGHQQPKLPADLGFYDLRLPEVRQAQADLAREHGIHGFCYYHYWFKGTRLIERPFDEVLESGQPDFPFCLCWANHTWSWRRGHGDEGRIMPQEYSEEDDREHIRWLLEAFKDERYIRVDGRPLLMIYWPHSMPDPKRTFEMWREEARKAGEKEPYICKAESFNNQDDPGEFGCEAAFEFWPHGLRNVAKLADDPDGLYGDNTVWEYRDVVEGHLNRPESPFKRFPCVIPHWDTTARFRPTGARIVNNSTPELYGGWLEGVIGKNSSRPADEQLVFINAWNEWGEGSYLEPDFKNGRAYLEATREALRNSGVEVSGGGTDEDAKDGSPAPAPYEKLHGDLQKKYERLQRRYQEQLSLEERSPLLRKAEQRARDLELLHQRMTARNERLRARNEGLEHHNTELENALEAQRRRSLRVRARNLLKRYAPSVESRLTAVLRGIRDRGR